MVVTEKSIDLERVCGPRVQETMTGRVLEGFRGPRPVDVIVDIVAGIGLERIRVDVAGQISVEDRGVRTSYLIPDNRMAPPKLLAREVLALTAEGWL